ncbi:MAG: FtsX-like permease family protein [Patescibacteria group bacterium]|jgi:putative ABC transport system permease protein
MDKKFLFKLAVKNLLAHRLRTVLTLAGIIIGISSVVFLISFGSGIQKLVTQQITGGDAFQLIDVGTGNSQIIKLNSETIDKIAKIQFVSSAETITNLGAKAKNGDNTMDTAFFATNEKYLDWSGKKIRYGRSLSSDNKQAVVNTSYLAFITKDNPESTLGKKINFDVIIPKELAKSGESDTKANQDFEIVGIIKDDSSPSVYVNAGAVSGWELLTFSQAKVRVTDRSKVDNIRANIEGFGLKTQYVGDTVSQVEQVFSVFKIVLGSFGFIAFLVALLGMFNTLTISLLERVKEVALMKILGMNKKNIQSLFMAEAVTLGIIGGAIGIIWGVVLGLTANAILNAFALRAGGDPVSVFYYPFSLIMTVVLIAVLVGFITGIYPARRAAQVNALDVLRYE